MNPHTKTTSNLRQDDQIYQPNQQNTLRKDHLIQSGQKVCQDSQNGANQCYRPNNQIDSHMHISQQRHNLTRDQLNSQHINLKRSRPMEEKDRQPIKKIKHDAINKTQERKNQNESASAEMENKTQNNQQKQDEIQTKERKESQRRLSNANKQVSTNKMQLMEIGGEQNLKSIQVRRREQNEEINQNMDKIQIVLSQRAAHPNISVQKESIESSQSEDEEVNEQQQSQQEYDENHLQSDYSSQQKYTICDSQLYLEFPPNMPNHPKRYIMSKFPNVVYNKFSAKRRQSILNKRRIFIPDEAHYLCHQKTPVSMQSFVTFNWVNLIEINFSSCNLTNQQFKTFVDNFNQYQLIKILYLSCNKNLTTVTQEMLQKFTKLQYVNFGQHNGKCHLNSESIQQLKNYQQVHPNVKLIYYQSS